jgi:ABC-type Fe3+ transport system permease subunit
MNDSRQHSVPGLMSNKEPERVLNNWAIWGFAALCWVLPLLATMYGCATSSVLTE